MEHVMGGADIAEYAASSHIAPAVGTEQATRFTAVVQQDRVPRDDQTSSASPVEPYRVLTHTSVHGEVTNNVAEESRTSYVSNVAESTQVGQSTEHTRKVSSTIIDSVALQEPPKDIVSYIDVPVYEENVIYKTAKETKYVDKVVTQERRQRVDRYKDVPPPPVYKEVPVVEYYEEKRVTKVPVVKKQQRTKFVDVPEYYDVEKPVIRTEPEYYDVEETVWEDRIQEVLEYDDEEVPVVVSQIVRPVITDSSKNVMDVNVITYEPEIIPIDVHVAKPVSRSLNASAVAARHRLANVASSQYNAILRKLNEHLDTEVQSKLPYIAEQDAVHFSSEAATQFIVAPDNISIEGYDRPAVKRYHTDPKMNFESGLDTEQLEVPAHKTRGVGLSTMSASQQGAHTSSIHTSVAGVSIGHAGDTKLSGTKEHRARLSGACCNRALASMSDSRLAADISGVHTALTTSEGHERSYQVSQSNMSKNRETHRTQQRSLARPSPSYPPSSGHGSKARLSNHHSQPVDTLHSYRSQGAGAVQLDRRSRVCC